MSAEGEAESPEAEPPEAEPGEAEPSEATSDGQRSPVPRGVRRVAVLIGALVVLGVVVRVSGLTGDLSVEGVRGTVKAAGHWGWLLYALLFCGCYLATVPGMLFVAAAVAAYGPLEGGLLGYVCALLAISCNFWAGRKIGGQDLGQVRWRLVRRLLAHLEDRPVRTIALSRLVMMLTPPYDYGLGLSKVTYPRFLLGSALGLAPPVLVVALLLDRLLDWIA